MSRLLSPTFLKQIFPLITKCLYCICILVHPSQSPLIYGVLHSLQEAICAFKDFIKGMPSAFKQVFRYKDMCFMWKCKSFLPRLQKIKICFLLVSAKTFLQPINLHYSIGGILVILLLPNLCSQCADICSRRANVYPQCADLCSRAANRDSFRQRTSLL